MAKKKSYNLNILEFKSERTIKSGKLLWSYNLNILEFK